MTDWIEQVSTKCEIDTEKVAKVLNKYNVNFSSTQPIPKNLLINKLSFSGIKTLNSGEEAFSYEKNLASGLWCITTNDDSEGKPNLVGKTSILGIILWLLSGKRSRIQEDVYSWIHQAKLEATFNSKKFTVMIVKKDKNFKGSLQLGKNNVEFTSEDEFVKIISIYMLKELELQELPYWQKDSDVEGYGQIQHMGWQNYIYALFISGSNLTSIIGEYFHGGSASRLLSMYIGLSWFETVATLRAHCKSITEKDKIVEKTESKYNEVNTKEIERIKQQIEALEKELLEDPNQFEKKIRETQEMLSKQKEVTTEWSLLSQNKNKLINDFELIEEALNCAKQELIDIEETQNINSFIKKLNPEFCPRCDKAISEENKQKEIDNNVCSVCGETHSSVDDIEEYQERLNEAKSRVAVLQEAYDKQNSEIKRTNKVQQAMEDQLTYLQREIEASKNTSETDTLNKQRKIELEISKLKGMLEIRTHYGGKKTSSKSLEKTNDDYKILNTTKIQAEKKLKESQSDFFESLNSAVLELGQSFGIEALEEVSIDGAATMRLKKGGVATSFSKVTPGEQLRLKIALIIGLLRVAKEKGIGRHPGLLLIDSLGNEEIGEKDFKCILTELNNITKETDNIQVIVTSAKFEDITDVIDSSRIIAPKDGEKYIW